MCLQRLKRLRSHNSLFLTELHLSGFSDSIIPQKWSNMLTTPNSPLPKFANLRTSLHTCLWQVQHDLKFESSINKFLGYLSTFRSWLLSQQCWDNHSQGIPPTCQLAIDTHLASTSFFHVHWKCGLTTTRWVSAPPQG